jgi:PAS domain S-box-containing protein
MGSRSIVVVTLVLSSIALALAGLGAYRAHVTLAAAAESLRNATDTELALERSLSLLREADASQRGYLLTGRDEYLGPYERALGQIETQLAELDTLVPDDSAAQRSFDELEALVRVKADELARTLDLVRGGATVDSIGIALTDAGQFAMDQIHALTERMRDDGGRGVDRQIEAERRARDAAGRSIVALAALAIAALVVLAFVVRRETAQRHARERELATTLRSLGDAVIATDDKGVVNLCNPAAELLTGWALGEARGKHLDEVFRIVDEGSRETGVSPAAKVQDGRLARLASHTVLIRRDGVETPIEYTAAPIVDEPGRVLGAVLVFRDATEMRTAQQSLRDADRRKNEFLAVLAHELRNPLAPIRQAAQIARSPSATPAQIAWSTEVIERQVGHMARLLDDLLDVSRITRGTLEVRRSRVELASVIEAAIEMARPLIDARRHTLTLDVSAEPLPLDADPLRIAQVIANLLSNAAKYTSPGGRIRLSAGRSGGYAVVHIVDNGAGLSREALATIFQIFVQIASPLDRDEGGLGIGLALSKGLVELHAGTIEASSPGPGHGSEFVVRLPLARETRDNAPKPAGIVAASQPSARGLRIVVADDNHDAAASLAALLELEGHGVEVVNDGAAALDAIRRLHPDIALLDIGMPSLNGYDVARRVRAAEWGGAGITLVAVTGWGQAADKDKAFDAGFDHHWVKPVKPSVALELCNAAAARRGASA